jgi:hypothetical protein
MGIWGTILPTKILFQSILFPVLAQLRRTTHSSIPACQADILTPMEVHKAGEEARERKNLSKRSF